MADVVVVGAGIVGAATAAFLAEAGASVTLVERFGPAAGASGRNSGVVQQPFDPVLAELHLATLRLYRSLEAALDGTFRLPAEPTGLLYVAADPAPVRALAEALRRSHPQLTPQVLEGRELTDLEPALAADLAACRLAIGYPVAPAAATLGYTGVAERLGARLVAGAPAELIVAGGMVRGVRVTGEAIDAPAVVVAAGPETPGLLDPRGRWRPIRPLWGVVEDVRLARPPGHVLEEAAVETAIEPGEASGGEIAFSLVTADGRSALGSAFLPAEPDPLEIVAAMRRRGRRFVPELDRAPAGPARSCARPLAADGRPLVGPVPWLRGAFVAAGHGPWGISTGPASARLVADLVLGRPAVVPQELDAGRFGGPDG